MEIRPIDIAKIRPNPFQPRREFDASKIAELGESIHKHGLIEPIVVTKKGDDYVIVAGERRYRAAQAAKLKDIPAIVKAYNSDVEMMRDCLIENELRESLSINEFTDFVYLLAKSLGEPYFIDGKIDAARLCEYLTGRPYVHGNTPPSFYQKLRRLLAVEENAAPQVKELLKEQKIDLATAAQIARIDNKSAQIELASLAKHKTTTEIRKEVTRYNWLQKADEEIKRSEQYIDKDKKVLCPTEMALKLTEKILYLIVDMKAIHKTINQITDEDLWNKFSESQKNEVFKELRTVKAEYEIFDTVLKKAESGYRALIAQQHP